MKKNIIIGAVAVFALFAISASAMVPPAPGIVGGDRDSHGCIPSAGFTWNEDKQECTRPWEDGSTGNQEQNTVRATLQAQVKQSATGALKQVAPRAMIKPDNEGPRDADEKARLLRATTNAATQTMRANAGLVRPETDEEKLQVRERLQQLHDPKEVVREGMRVEAREIHATSTEAIRRMREEVPELRLQIKERVRELRASSTAKREEIKDEAQKKRLEMAHKHTDLINARVEAAIERVQKLSERASGAFDNLEERGINVDTARTLLAEAVVKIDSARTQAAAIALAIEAAFAGGTPKEDLKAVQPLIKEMVTTLQEAHRLIAQAIASVKPGLNKEQPATTTAE